MDDKRRAIFGEVNYELDYQQVKFGTTADDTKNTPNDWNSFISHFGTRWFPGGFAPYKTATVDAFRTAMVKVAALAVSAIESIDRQRETNGKTFYEDVEG